MSQVYSFQKVAPYFLLQSHVVSAFEHSLANMTNRLAKLTNEAEDKVINSLHFFLFYVTFCIEKEKENVEKNNKKLLWNILVITDHMYMIKGQGSKVPVHFDHDVLNKSNWVVNCKTCHIFFLSGPCLFL